jgi:hypothetical protein
LLFLGYGEEFLRAFVDLKEEKFNENKRKKEEKITENLRNNCN